jgi:hypothetical protein
VSRYRAVAFNGIIPAEMQLPVLAGKKLELAPGSFHE